MPAIALKSTPVSKASLPVEPSQDSIPIPIRRILDDDIKPPREEYSQLKELDTRIHVLKFSTDISKKYSVYRQENVDSVTLNRYA